MDAKFKTTNRVCGVRFDPVRMDEALATVDRFVSEKPTRGPKHVCTGNLDHLRLASEDPDFAEIYEHAGLNLADGMPVVWLSWLNGCRLPERVTGIDLSRKIMLSSARKGHRIFLLGGEPGAAYAVKNIMQRSGANIVGAVCPCSEDLIDPSENARIVEEIARAKADILLVALGAPKQEKWIAENIHATDVAVAIGVGGAFEMIAGLKKRAPKIVQRMGMEWLWRTAQDPVRLFDRYFMKDIPFLVRSVINRS